MNNSLADIVNLRQYPLVQPESVAYKNLVSEASSQLAKKSICVLPDFFHQDGIRWARQSIRQIEHLAEPRRFKRTPYVFNPPTRDVPLDDPRRQAQEYDISYLYGGQLDADQAIRVVYRWNCLHDFLSLVVGHRLFPLADTTYDLIVSLIHDGGIHGWHFDSNEFAVSLMLEPSETGGVFEYVPDIRTHDDERFDDVTRVLSGERHRVRSVAVTPGTLVLFRGHYALHRVSRVGGARPRCMAIMSFDRRPGMVLDNAGLRGDRTN